MATTTGGQPVLAAAPPPTNTLTATYATILNPTTQTTSHTTQTISTVAIKKPKLLNGRHTISWHTKEIEQSIIQTKLQYAIMGKFKYGNPDINELRRVIPVQCKIKGEITIGVLETRLILIRCTLKEDYVNLLSSTGFWLTLNNESILMRTLKWETWYDSKKETSIAIAWISFPNLPPNLFAREFVYSIALAIGNPLHVDMATKNNTRPSCARVKVEIDLLKDLPEGIEVGEHNDDEIITASKWINIRYDYLPKYCKTCYLQGHDEEGCYALHPELFSKKDTADTNDKAKQKDGDSILTNGRVVFDERRENEWQQGNNNRNKGARKQHNKSNAQAAQKESERPENMVTKAIKIDEERANVHKIERNQHAHKGAKHVQMFKPATGKVITIQNAFAALGNDKVDTVASADQPTNENKSAQEDLTAVETAAKPPAKAVTSPSDIVKVGDSQSDMVTEGAQAETLLVQDSSAQRKPVARAQSTMRQYVVATERALSHNIILEKGQHSNQIMESTDSVQRQRVVEIIPPSCVTHANTVTGIGREQIFKNNVHSNKEKAKDTDMASDVGKINSNLAHTALIPTSKLEFLCKSNKLVKSGDKSNVAAANFLCDFFGESIHKEDEVYFLGDLFDASEAAPISNDKNVHILTPTASQQDDAPSIVDDKAVSSPNTSGKYKWNVNAPEFIPKASPQLGLGLPEDGVLLERMDLDDRKGILRRQNTVHKDLPSKISIIPPGFVDSDPEYEDEDEFSIADNEMHAARIGALSPRVEEIKKPKKIIRKRAPLEMRTQPSRSSKTKSIRSNDYVW